MTRLHQATGIAIGGRGILIEGPPGSGKTSLALALIDRGATLIGDDGVTIEVADGRLFASPPPATSGLLEVRNVGIITRTVAQRIPIALVLRFDREAPRHVEAAEPYAILGCTLPLIRLYPDSPVLALRAELALSWHGIA